MASKSEQNDLGDKIAELLQDGITISDDVMHYIDSTFSNPSLEEFHQILSDPSNFETETVFELIFYPDEKIQEKIESVLKTSHYVAEDIEPTLRYLLEKKIVVPVVFPDRRGSLVVPLPDSAMRQFLTRLNISKHIDRRLEEVLSRFMSDEKDNLRIRVLLRNCRANLSGQACDFLGTCIEKMYSASDYFWDALTFLLNFFEYMDPAKEIYLSLMQEKKSILHSIEHAEKIENALKRNSIEALMMKGMNICAINIADERKKTVLIDHICISVFGKTEFFGLADPADPPVTAKHFMKGELPEA